MLCNCPKELSQQSALSPVAADSTRIIADSEAVLRVVREGIEWDDINRTLKLFPSQDLQDEKRGVSVCRKDYTSSEKITDLNAKPVLGAFEASCIAIREITVNDVPYAVCVIDDGNDKDPSHALVIKSQAMNAEIPNKKAILRGKLSVYSGSLLAVQLGN
jgi:hypothetical protein